MPASAIKTARRVRDSLHLAIKKFMRIEGGQRAAAFAYNAFFSLFPLLILLIAAASLFVDHTLAGQIVIGYVERYVPLSGEMQQRIFGTISGMVKGRGQAGTVALLMLVWVSTQFFTTLIHAANRAWGTEGTNWWHMPLKSLLLLGIMVAAVLLGTSLPVLGAMAKRSFSGVFFFSRVYNLSVIVLHFMVVFFSLSLFYKLAPRRRTRFSEVWLSALCATTLLQAAQGLFILYLKHFHALNAMYGAFGGVMALLLWIYLSGCIFIFCACLCSAQAETRAIP
jgi:Ca2+-transporting ATPase